MQATIRSCLLWMHVLCLASAYPQSSAVKDAKGLMPEDGVRYNGLECKTPHNQTDRVEGPGMMEVYNYHYRFTEAPYGFAPDYYIAFLERAFFLLSAEKELELSEWDWPLSRIGWRFDDKKSDLSIIIGRGPEQVEGTRSLSYRDIRQIIDTLRLKWSEDFRRAGLLMPGATFILSIDDLPFSIMPVRMAVGLVGPRSSTIGLNPGNVTATNRNPNPGFVENHVTATEQTPNSSFVETQ